MPTLQSHFQFSPKLIHLKNPHSFSFSKKILLPRRLSLAKRFNGLLSSRFINCSVASSSSSSSAGIEKSVSSEIVNERLPFDINLAVILAGFAFEAYCSPPENVGKREMDAAKCQTVFLSESFVREIYDGQLFVKLKKGFNFPAMDPWGTSDPYVIVQLESQIVKSKVKWGTKEPKWNEEFSLNIKQPPVNDLQIAAWDANLVAPHKRMGNAGINLENLCDGDSHQVLLDLEGMGGGGKIELEIKYKSFEKIDDEKKWWKIPLVTEFLQKHGFEPALKMIVGSETVQAREFVQFAFGQLKSLNDSYLQKDWFSKTKSATDPDVRDKQSELGGNGVSNNETSHNGDSNKSPKSEDDVVESVDKSSEEIQVVEDSWSDNMFWKTLADSINQNIVQKLGLPAPEKMKWDGFDVLKNFGILSREIAEASYVESGLATPTSDEAVDGDAKDGSSSNQMSLTDIKKVTQEILRQTDSVLGALMVVNAAVTKLSNEAGILIGQNGDTSEAKKEVLGDEESKALISQEKALILNEKEAEEMRELFSTAESAMEAWALLANALGHPTFIKSEFEKICFLDNEETDTQVAIWRDLKRKRLVIAFRGTEQTKWKDLLTDLMLVPAGLNPERIGGDSNEVQVHSGFLNAYDSVRTRLITLIKQATGHSGESVELLPKWHIYVTGHSLGGALATLLALELSSSQLAQRGAISVTMYNFGSPRVGNRRFAEIYNEKVKDSWRLVNHRDIIPTVPRLMGYCHVAQPVYLVAGNRTDDAENVDVLEDGYEGDIIGEATPDVIVGEFMRGEKELVENILNTEINIFRAIRDGSALMQHMEDFYYISLLEKVRSNYQTGGGSQTADRKLSEQA